MKGRPFTEKDIEKIVTHPIYAITGMVPEELAVRSMIQAIETLGPEKFIRSMVQNMRDLFCYDADERCITVTIGLEGEGHKLWDSIAKARLKEEERSSELNRK